MTKNPIDNDLSMYLLNYAMAHGIGYTLVKAEPNDPSVSFKSANYMVINTNWQKPAEVPFIIAHEIGHLMLGDHGVMYYGSFAGKLSEERPADLYGLKLIYDYACKQGEYFEEPIDFLNAYGIPHRMLNAAATLFETDSE